MVKVGEVVELMEFIAPSWMACKGDVNGLQAGSVNSSVKKILLSLDATSRTVDYAAKNKFKMILTHHPRFFRTLDNVCRDSFSGSIAHRLCKHDIALFNAHTNLDIVPGGINDILADIAGINSRSILDPVIHDKLLKLGVYVPEEYADELRLELSEAGAGEIGNYSEVCYKTLGLGCFRPGEGAAPHTGSVGQLYEGEEWKLEMLLPASSRKSVESVLRKVHPYEEPAYDFIPTESSKSYGFGRVGDLKKEVLLTTLARRLKKATGSKAVQVLESGNKSVKKVAVWSGSGVNISKVISSGADCLVCGELGYHYAEELEFYGVSAIVLGHCPCEDIALAKLRDDLLAGLGDVEVEIAPRFSPDFISV